MAKTDNTYYSCSYKIKATGGAPGFRFTSNAPTNNIKIMWYEYDLDKITKYGSTLEWPLLAQNPTEVSCENNCFQGEMVTRYKSGSSTTRVIPYEILLDL